MTKEQKLMYLVGANDGIGFATNKVESALLNNQGKYGACKSEEVAEIIGQIGIPGGVTIGQLMDGLNQTYADYRNVGIPTVPAMRIVERAIKGASEQDITRLLEAQRRAVSK